MNREERVVRLRGADSLNYAIWRRPCVTSTRMDWRFGRISKAAISNAPFGRKERTSTISICVPIPAPLGNAFPFPPCTDASLWQNALVVVLRGRQHSFGRDLHPPNRQLLPFAAPLPSRHDARHPTDAKDIGDTVILPRSWRRVGCVEVHGRVQRPLQTPQERRRRSGGSLPQAHAEHVRRAMRNCLQLSVYLLSALEPSIGSAFLPSRQLPDALLVDDRARRGVTVWPRSSEGRPVEVITVAQTVSDPARRRPVVFLTGRAHPGETPASWCLHGLLRFLSSSTTKAERARRRLIWIIVSTRPPPSLAHASHRFNRNVILYMTSSTFRERFEISVPPIP